MVNCFDKILISQMYIYFNIWSECLRMNFHLYFSKIYASRRKNILSENVLQMTIWQYSVFILI